MTTIIEHALSLEISRRFAATPARVFDAWLSEDWGQWLGPRGARCEKASVEPRVGGRYAMTMTMADGRTAEVSGVYLEIVRPRQPRRSATVRLKCAAAGERGRPSPLRVDPPRGGGRSTA
jgi:hypothetical protein